MMHQKCKILKPTPVDYIDERSSKGTANFGEYLARYDDGGEYLLIIC
jgi:hypothetical protein